MYIEGYTTIQHSYMNLYMDILGFIILITIRKHLRVGENIHTVLIWYSIDVSL